MIVRGESRLSVGDVARDFVVTDLDGRRHALQDYRGRRLLLSFYRYAACPLCNLRIHELSKHLDEFEKLGLSTLAIFQSPADSMRRHLEKNAMPFPIVADPERLTYATYGLESSLVGFAVAMVHPRSIVALVKGFLPGRMEGDKLLHPADFVIGPDQKVETAYYGKHIGDHLPLSDLLACGLPADEVAPPAPQTSI